MWPGPGLGPRQTKIWHLAAGQPEYVDPCVTKASPWRMPAELPTNAMSSPTMLTARHLDRELPGQVLHEWATGVDGTQGLQDVRFGRSGE